jgi:hypothetical protein
MSAFVVGRLNECSAFVLGRFIKRLEILPVTEYFPEAFLYTSK